jgi:hypothetical protein
MTEKSPKYTSALAVLTSFFFMWGFITCLNDIIIPHLKSVFELNYAQAMRKQAGMSRSTGGRFIGSVIVRYVSPAKVLTSPCGGSDCVDYDYDPDDGKYFDVGDHFSRTF